MMRPKTMLVLYAGALHLAWGAALLATGQHVRFTNASFLDGLLHRTGIEAAVLIAASLLALWATRPGPRPRLRALALLPQQGLLALSAASALSAVLAQHYGDGVPRPWVFIGLDQLPSLLGYGLHTIVVLDALRGAFARRAGGDGSEVSPAGAP